MQKRIFTRTLLKKGMLSLFAFLLVGSTLQAQTVPTSTPLPVIISNDAPGTTPLNPFEIEFPVAAINPGNTSLEVTLGFDHTWAGDLVFTLIDPSGNEAVLVAGLGGPTDMTGSTVTFSPLSATPNTDFPFCAGATCDILPAMDFSCLLVTQGTWIVRIEDTAGGDDGPLNSASINFVNDPNQGPPVIYTFDHDLIVGTGTPSPIDNMLDPAVVEFVVSGETNQDMIQLKLDLNHTWAGDIVAVLVAPNGVDSIQIFNALGGNTDLEEGDDITVTDCGEDGTDISLCMGAGGGSTCELSPTGGTFADLLATVVAANGSVDGTWTLTITDTANGDEGSVNFAALCFGRIDDCIPGGPIGIPTMGEWGLFLFFLVTLNLGLVFMHKMEAQKDLAMAGGSTSTSFSSNLPFEMNAFQAAMKHALGLAVVGFAIILLVWGSIVPMDLIGMVIAIPMVAYTLQMINLLKK